VTYTLVAPCNQGQARLGVELYRAVHEALVGLLTSEGFDVRRRGTEAPPPQRPFLCFADRDAEDVVAGCTKVVGSAQRKRSGAVLQHGSILLAPSRLVPEFHGLAAAGGVVGSAESWASKLRAAIPAALGFATRASSWPDELLVRARDLRATLYDSEKWTRKR
jgi:lipoate-protein ligase A